MVKYIKTVPIEAEQFDGSDEMIEKYHLGFWKGIDTSIVYEYGIPTLEGAMDLGIGDWIATGVNGEYWAINDDTFKKTYVELPVIPQYVADYMVYWKEQNNSLIDITLESAHTRMDSNDSSKSFEWVQSHFERFARAWIDGYKVAE